MMIATDRHPIADLTLAKMDSGSAQMSFLECTG